MHRHFNTILGLSAAHTPYIVFSRLFWRIFRWKPIDGKACATNSFRPAMVPDQLITLGVIDQGSQIDHLQRGHGRYRLRDDAGNLSNQKPSRKDMICHRTWVRWSHPSAPPPAPRNPG